MSEPNFIYYPRKFSYNFLPVFYFQKNYGRLKAYEKICNTDELHRRLHYYCKLDAEFELPKQAIANKDFKKTKGTNYYLDLKEFLHYFSPDFKFAYHFGDETHINDYPTLFKARPITENNSNSILFKLNKRRHFRWIKDPYTFREKKNMMIYRGEVRRGARKAFVEKYHEHQLCNVGQTNKKKENVPWQKERIPMHQQLEYKFIFCPEGNDVATSLKWVMSSNSLCIMPKPRFETWFMEGTLQAGVHYLELKDDFSNLEALISYYSAHPEEAEQIIDNAHAYIQNFKNQNMEDLLCLKVLEKYASLSHQKNVIKF